MKYCTNCGNEISENSDVCTKCGKFVGKQSIKVDTKKKKKWVVPLIIGLCFVFLIGVFSGNDSDDNALDNEKGNNSTIQNQEKIEYIKVSKDDLDEALEKNAAAAKDTYNNKYVEISGKLGTIDSDLKYISLMSATDSWDFNGIHCRIKNSEQREVVKTLATDQKLVIKGKITDVGEVLGYYLDIIEIVID